jgi:hypothetical protein
MTPIDVFTKEQGEEKKFQNTISGNGFALLFAFHVPSLNLPRK